MGGIFDTEAGISGELDDPDDHTSAHDAVVRDVGNLELRDCTGCSNRYERDLIDNQLATRRGLGTAQLLLLELPSLETRSRVFTVNSS